MPLSSKRDSTWPSVPSRRSDGRDQAAHQRAVAVGERLQSGMGAAAVELIVKRAVLVQHAVDDVGGDPPRRETGHFGRRSETLRWHAA